MTTSIEFLMERAYANAEGKGFWDDRSDSIPTKATMIALEHSELSERLEAIRKPGNSEHIPEFSAEMEEIADSFIRWADYATGFFPTRSIIEAILAKMEYNEGRPHMHGKKA